jgi:thiamine-monophosphate kinase
MRLKDIGEFGLIDKLKKELKSDKSVICSIGEDAAVIKYTKDAYLLFASDMLMEDVHFKISKEKDIFLKIGHKALACNISDIVAMGGVPKYAVVNLGIAPNLNLNKVFDIFSGLKKIAKKFGVNIVGGDLSKSNKIIIDVSLIGFAKKKNLTLRSTAKSGDIIFVTGPLGGSSSGKHLTFTPRLKEAQFLLRNYKINAMIDISDGLIQDLWQILRTSRKGAILYEELLPIATLAKDIKSALYEGEDFELLFTVSPKTAKKIIRDARIRVYRIGEIVRDRKKFDLIDKKGCQKKLKLIGFKHF